MDAHETIAATFRAESGRVLASLISALGDFTLAEDALQEALIIALERWPIDGIPQNPGAWITTTARRKAIDQLRRSVTLTRKTPELAMMLEEVPTSDDENTIPDERLKLILTCC